MNKIFADQLTTELKTIALQSITDKMETVGGEWIIVEGSVDGAFNWCDSTGTVRLVMYRQPGVPLDFEIDDVWFAGRA